MKGRSFLLRDWVAEEGGGRPGDEITGEGGGDDVEYFSSWEVGIVLVRF